MIVCKMTKHIIKQENKKLKKKVGRFTKNTNIFLAGAVVGAFAFGAIQGLIRESRTKSDLETKVERVEDVNKYKGNKINYEYLYGMIKRYEGIRSKAYPDSRGILTVGVGFNLEKQGAKERIESLGLDYQAVCNKKQELSIGQIYTLMKEDVETAISDAKFYLGKDWHNLDSEAQEIIIDMSYNLGRDKLLDFKKLKEALRNRDYAEAAEEMRDSKWYSQTGFRAQELVLKMGNLD